MTTEQILDKKLHDSQLVAVGHNQDFNACPMVFWLEGEDNAYLSFYENPQTEDFSRTVRQIPTPNEAELFPLTDFDLIDFLKVGFEKYFNVDSTGKVKQIDSDFVAHHYEKALKTTSDEAA